MFFHIVTVVHAPLYREENAGALRQDWPRVPLPKEASTLRAGAVLGRRLAALLDPDTPVPGVRSNNSIDAVRQADSTLDPRRVATFVRGVCYARRHVAVSQSPPVPRRGGRGLDQSAAA